MLQKIATAFAVAGLFVSANSLRADTLHGFCWGTSTCSDNGSNTPTSSNPPQFGFEGSGNGNTSANLFIDFLVPTSVDPSPSTLAISVKNGSATTSASLFSATNPWSSGQLDAYLGISASPANPIGAYTGSPFYVYQDNLGTQSIGGTGGGTQLNLALVNSLPQGSYILAFFNTGTTSNPNFSGTANSGAILINGVPRTPPVPEPSTLMLLGTGIIGAAGFARRRLLA